ncbi:MAG: hypothetical protein ACLQLG_13575 [Thermoguttaceae bacterium]
MQIYEDNPTYQLTATSISQRYNIIEAAGLDRWIIRAALLSYAPVSNAPPGARYAWPRRGLTLDEVDASAGVWKASITWASLNYQYATKIGGQQQQVQMSRQLRGVFGDQTAVPSWIMNAYNAGGIGVVVGWDGHTAHGTSIYVPQRTWTESVEIPASDYSFDYEQQVEALQNTPLNEAPFRGRDVGEVLFLGMNAQLNAQNPDFVSAAFEFSSMRNNSVQNGNQISIDGISGISKGGWDYLDIFFKPTLDEASSKVAPKAQYVLVHQMYYIGDFSVLNIGTDENLPLWKGPIGGD